MLYSYKTDRGSLYPQIVLLLVWTVLADCLTDWELDNFGIRTEHHKDDLINKVNLDKNAPKLIRSQKRPRHHRRPPRNQEKTRINFRIRDRDRSQESIENPSVLSRTAQSSPVSSSFLPESNFAASIQHKPSFAEFKENFLGSRAVSETASGHGTEVSWEIEGQEVRVKLNGLFTGNWKYATSRHNRPQPNTGGDIATKEKTEGESETGSPPGQTFHCSCPHHHQHHQHHH